ncbi:response regulator [Pontibaca methylaminivorans]|uniref:response regulator n=1 Tax=Pontibaca methylaminivorans TaxID=515897 RepID=UPI002FDB0E60
MSPDICLPLAGKTILVVEDEYFQAEDLEQALVKAGARLAGPCPSVAAGRIALEDGGPVDAAVLDINLGGEDVYALAEILNSREIPFLFATGYDRASLPRSYRGIPVLEKPFGIEQLLDVLVGLCERGERQGPARRQRARQD